MKKIKVIMSIFALQAVTIAALMGCSALDVIGNNSIEKFNEVLQVSTEEISIDETDNSYMISTADDSAALIWGNQKIAMVLDSKPFVDAGVELSSLPENMVDGDQIVIEVSVQGNSFEEIVNANREAIGFHDSLGHYGYDFGNGNAFEWAQDIIENDKDIVFALNPEPFISAGADIEKIAGWSFSKVETMDENGDIVEKDKFLKPINL